MNDKAYMQLAIQKAREGIAADQEPFGALVVRDGSVVASAYATVPRDCDPTAHAEVNAIRQAATALRNTNLSGCTMFSTCEPCPMCLGAIYVAKIDRVVYGAKNTDATAAGFPQLDVNASVLAKMGKSQLRVEAGPFREVCCALFTEWQEKCGGTVD